MPQRRTTVAAIGGWMLLVFTTSSLWAQTKYNGEPLDPGHGPGWGVQGPPTGMDQIRQYPHPGPEWAATHGYPNYDLPDRHFDVWFRSQAWGLTKRERCAIPDPWKPRGFGNLFARPVTSHRMDYNRPVLVYPYSEYGPSYFVREPDPECCVRDCQGHCYAHQQLARERALERALSQPCDE